VRSKIHFRRKFTTSIRSKSLDFEIKLIFYSYFEVFENIKNIRIEFEQIYLSKLSKVINKHKVVSKVINRHNKGRNPNINMNEFKRCFRLNTRFNKRELVHFATKAMFTMCYNCIIELEYI